jgi:hypothetical protein
VRDYSLFVSIYLSVSSSPRLSDIAHTVLDRLVAARRAFQFSWATLLLEPRWCDRKWNCLRRRDRDTYCRLYLTSACCRSVLYMPSQLMHHGFIYIEAAHQLSLPIPEDALHESEQGAVSISFFLDYLLSNTKLRIQGNGGLRWKIIDPE